MESGGGRTHVALLVALWFACNVGVLLLNKTLLSTFGFGYPVFLTACHMATCVVVSQAALSYPLNLVPREALRSERQRNSVAVLSVVFCASVVAGNVSLRYIAVSFNQAVSSTDPAFTAAFAFLLHRKRESPQVYAALVPIVLGTALASGFEPLFNALGFSMCLAAAASRALKSVLQDALLSDGDKLHSLNLLAHMAPLALALLTPLVLLLERGAPMAALELARSSPSFPLVLALNCCAAAGVNLSNFLVTRATSALTLQVLGKAKSVVAVAASLLLFRNPVSALGLAGYGVCLLGVAAYSRAKSASRHALAPALADGEAGTPLRVHVHRG